MNLLLSQDTAGLDEGAADEVCLGVGGHQSAGRRGETHPFTGGSESLVDGINGDASVVTVFTHV